MNLTKRFWNLAATAMMIGFAAEASAQMLINGAGATFPYPIYSKWFDEYVKVDSSVRFNYQSIGSGGGQKQILAETVDFGASDGPMSDENLAKAPGKLLHIPTVAGAVRIVAVPMQRSRSCWSMYRGSAAIRRRAKSKGISSSLW